MRDWVPYLEESHLSYCTNSGGINVIHITFYWGASNYRLENKGHQWKVWSPWLHRLEVFHCITRSCNLLAELCVCHWLFLGWVDRDNYISELDFSAVIFYRVGLQSYLGRLWKTWHIVVFSLCSFSRLRLTWRILPLVSFLLISVRGVGFCIFPCNLHGR